MSTIGEQVLKVRSKNAGPFWITIDIFCGNQEVFDAIGSTLTTDVVATLYNLPASTMKRFEIPSLDVLKFSFPRPVVQGSRFDRDMHGAQWAVVLAEFDPSR